MKKSLLLSLSLVLLLGACAIGVYGNSNESEKKSVVTSNVDSEFDYLETMDGLEELVKIEGLQYLVAVDVVEKKDESILTTVVGHLSKEKLVIGFSESTVIEGFKKDRSEKIKQRIDHLRKFYQTEPLFTSSDLITVGYGGRQLGRTAKSKLYEHVLEIKDGMIEKSYFKKV